MDIKSKIKLLQCEPFEDHETDHHTQEVKLILKPIKLQADEGLFDSIQKNANI